MTQHKIDFSYILFLSSSKILEYKPGIIRTTDYFDKGKYMYTINVKAYSHLNAVKKRSNEELIQFLESKGFKDIEYSEVDGRLGFNDQKS